jgi:alpha-mannosidase
LGGNAVLSYRVENGCYQIERNNAIETLDKALEYVGKSPLQHHCAFIGLGNHGGGASRRHILEATQWAKQHPEIICKFSTLTEFFHLAEKEKNIPVFKGELNFSLRGCHSSAAVIKHKYREMEKTVKRARAIAPAADWEAINKGLSFNAFHDIIPGSSIDRANREQVTWMDNVIHAAREIEFDALNQRANAVTVQVEPGKGDNPCAVPYYLYNSSPFEFNGIVEIETCIDYRPRFDYTNRGDELPLELLDGGKAAAFQVLQTEHSAFEEFPWRRRVAFNTTIPPMSGKIVTLGYKEKPRTAKSPKWQNNCTVLVKNKKLLINGQAVEVATYNDKYGSWGDMNEGVDGYTCPEKFETWKITNVIEKFDGAILKECFVEFKGGRSTLMLRLRRYFDKNEVELNGTILWQERNVRLRLTLPGSKKITYQNPGGEITRSIEGDVPGGRYADLNDGRVICSDNISGFTVLGSKLHVNLIRGSICASSRLDQGDLTRSLTDLGRHEFKLLFTDDKRRAEDMLYDVAQVMTFVHNGNKQKISKTEISSKNVRLLEVNPGSIIVQLQNSKDETVKINGKNVKLKAWQITRLKV